MAKTREEYNAYMRKYVLKRYHERRAEAVAKLGGVCVDCGSSDELEFDHVDPATKMYEIARVWSFKVELFWAEIAKCVLRCAFCHHRKTILSQGKVVTKGENVHGTITSYKYCKCDECRKAWNKYMKEYKEKKRSEKI